MVFLYGYDVPIVEVFITVSIMNILALALLLWSLHRSKQMNKKLDKLLGEEKTFKQELDVAEQEEEEQLKVMRTIVKEMHTLEHISSDEHEGMAAVQRLAQKAAKHIRVHDKGTHPGLKEVLDELTRRIQALDAVSTKEDKQLETINRIVSKIRR